MRFVRVETLIDAGGYSENPVFSRILDDVKAAVAAVHWPEGNDKFTINPVRHGNGVAPIKLPFLTTLRDRKWTLEERYPGRSSENSNIRPGAFDAHLDLSKNGLLPFVVEWETGNISSSHRAMNKMAMGIENKVLSGGLLIVPTRELYKWLTDRIGNFGELQAYIPLWSRIQVAHGYLGMVLVEYDELNNSVDLLPKGDDGRAKEYQRKIANLLAAEAAKAKRGGA